MAKTKKEELSCHDCGLEDIEACQDIRARTHQSSMPDELPCSACARNPEQVGGKYDFYYENWTTIISNGKATAILEDENDETRELSERLATLRGGGKLGV
jgi:hypothetical protein